MSSVLVHPFHSVCSSFKLIFSFTLSRLTEFSLSLCMCEPLRLMMGLLTDMLTLSVSQVLVIVATGNLLQLNKYNIAHLRGL